MCIIKGLIYFTKDAAFTLDQTSFPKGSLSFNTYPKFLEIEGTYQNDIVTIQITDFHPVEMDGFYTQILTGNIKQIRFENLNWQEFQRLLGSYKKTELLPFIDESTLVAKNNPDTNTFSQGVKPETIFRPRNIFVEPPYTPPQDKKRIEEIEVSYKDAYFGNGYVEFSKKFTWHHEHIYFKILNPSIIHEFNNIKDYFAKAINGKRRFKATAIITLRYTQEVIDSSATSEDIEKIGPALIEGIKKRITNKLVAVNNTKGRKTILDAEEIFKELDEVSQNIFKQSESDILSVLIEEREIRNKRQLQYLAGEKQSTNDKLRFTLSPLFGFLFYIEGVNKKYFCWELLNSHATYLWSFDKDFQDAHLRIEETISFIQGSGRQIYRDNYKKGLVDQDIKFIIIDHKGDAANDLDTFPEWKRKFEEAII